MWVIETTKVSVPIPGIGRSLAGNYPMKTRYQRYYPYNNNDPLVELLKYLNEKNKDPNMELLIELGISHPEAAKQYYNSLNIQMEKK
jgi:hypothetical protein